MRTLLPPVAITVRLLIRLREKLVKIGAKVVRYAIFQMAEVAATKELFDRMLQKIDLL